MSWWAGVTRDGQACDGRDGRAEGGEEWRTNGIKKFWGTPSRRGAHLLVNVVRSLLEYPSPEGGYWACHIGKKSQCREASRGLERFNFKFLGQGARWRVCGDGFRSLTPTTMAEKYDFGAPGVWEAGAAVVPFEWIRIARRYRGA